MRMLFLVTGLLLTAGTALAQEQRARTPGDSHEKHAIVVLPEKVEWQPAPASLPPGARVAVLEGDPSRPGPFTMRVWLPAGYRIPPHFHPSEERVTVVSGTFYVGMGERFDENAAVTLPVGTYAALGPGVAHYAFTRGVTVIQLNNVGPWGLTYVNRADDPRQQP